MDFNLVVIAPSDLNKVLDLFKMSAEKIAKKNIDHWQYWKNPPIEKINWVKEGISNSEFFFLKSIKGEILGMVRILDKDFQYWGEMNDKAIYVHSLVVLDKYSGLGIGSRVLQKIGSNSKDSGCSYLRLDCDLKNSKLCEYYTKQGFEKVGEVTLPISTYNLYQRNI